MFWLSHIALEALFENPHVIVDRKSVRLRRKKNIKKMFPYKTYRKFTLYCLHCVLLLYEYKSQLLHCAKRQRPFTLPKKKIKKSISLIINAQSILGKLSIAYIHTFGAQPNPISQEGINHSQKDSKTFTGIVPLQSKLCVFLFKFTTFSKLSLTKFFWPSEYLYTADAKLLINFCLGKFHYPYREVDKKK